MQETSETYNSAMAATGEALVQAASAVLTQQAQEQLSFEGDSDEFGQRLCETMAEFGATHLHCLPTHDSKILFLQQARGTLVDVTSSSFAMFPCTFRSFSITATTLMPVL